MNLRNFTLLTLLSLTACDTIEAIYTDVPKGVAEAQATLAAAEHTALVYAALPVCGTTSSPLCRDKAITAKIGEIDNEAYIAVQAARQAETQTALSAAMTALNALTAITNNLPVGAAQ